MLSPGYDSLVQGRTARRVLRSRAIEKDLNTDSNVSFKYPALLLYTEGI